MITLHVDPNLLNEFNQYTTEFDAQVELEKAKVALKELVEASRVANIYLEQMVDVTDWQTEYLNGLITQLNEAIENAESVLS